MRATRFVLVIIVAIGLAAPIDPVVAARSPLCRHGQLDVERDPSGVLPLTGANPIAPATGAAMRYEKSSSRPQVQSTLFATADRVRGPQATYECGVQVRKRTVVVYISDRARLPAQSASERVYFVGRFKTGYHVWQVVH